MIADILISIALAGAGPAPLATPNSERISTAMRNGEPIVTDADNAMIRAKCGYTGEEPERGNVSFRNGALQCQDGRVIKDAETEEMAQRIGARATAKVRAVMSQPQVRAALSGEATARAREAVRRAQVHLRYIGRDRD